MDLNETIAFVKERVPTAHTFQDRDTYGIRRRFHSTYVETIVSGQASLDEAWEECRWVLLKRDAGRAKATLSVVTNQAVALWDKGHDPSTAFIDDAALELAQAVIKYLSSYKAVD